MTGFFDERQLAHAPLRELHNGGWTGYAETPHRAASIAGALGGLQPARDFGMAPLAAVHDQDYLGFLSNAFERWRSAGREGDAIGYAWPVVGRRALDLERIDAQLGRYSFDAATPIAEGTWQSAYWSAQTALTALDHLLEERAPSAFALCRPPGHHAGRDYLGGYCYLNNAAIAAQQATARGAGPVAILDIDYHHGNGTQDIFYARGDVLFVSIHADPASAYPFYWGRADEQGEGEGEGATLNLTLAADTGLPAYCAALDRALAAIDDRGARLLVVSFGADTYAGDPIAGFAITTKDYRTLGKQVSELGLRSLVVAEGGYDVDALGANYREFIEGLG